MDPISPDALVRSSQPGNRQLMPGLAKRALRIFCEHNPDVGPILAC